MSVNKIPGIWDYIGEGLTSLDNAREKKRAEKIQEFSLINQLYQSGAADSGQLSAAAQATGIPSLAGLRILPSQAERKNKILNSAPVNITTPTGLPGTGAVPAPTPTISVPKANTITDTEAEAAGLTGPTQRRQQIASAKAAEASAKAGAAAAEAQPKDIALRQQSESDEHFKGAAQRFVSAQVDPTKLTAAQRDKAVDAAFAQYKAMRQTSQMGQIPDESYAKQFFYDAFNNMLIEKRKQDIQEKAASLGRISDEDRNFAMVTTRLESVRKALDDMRTNNKMLTFYLDKPEEQVPDFAKPDMLRYRQLLDLEHRLTLAQSSVADPRMGSGNVTMQQPPSAQITPQAKATPAPVGDVTAQIIDRIMAGSATLADARALVGKKITQDQYLKIANAVRDQQSKRNKARGGT